MQRVKVTDYKAVIQHNGKNILVDLKTYASLRLSKEEFDNFMEGYDYLTDQVTNGVGSPWAEDELYEVITTSYGSKFQNPAAKVVEYYKGESDPRITYDYFYEKMGQDPDIIGWRPKAEEIIG